MKKCPQCKVELALVAACEPWNTEYLTCPKCEGSFETFTTQEQDDESWRLHCERPRGKQFKIELKLQSSWEAEQLVNALIQVERHLQSLGVVGRGAVLARKLALARWKLQEDAGLVNSRDESKPNVSENKPKSNK